MKLSWGIVGVFCLLVKREITGMTCIFFFLKIYLFIWESENERERESTWEGGGSEGEAGSPPSREPDAGLDPGTPGSWPEPKAVA